MPLNTYAQLVLAGLKKHGFSETDIESTLRLRANTLQRLLSGDAKLSDRHEDLIEAKTGKSSGEFAMSILDPQGKSELSAIISRMGVGPSPTTQPPKPANAKHRRPSHRPLKLA